MRKQIIPFFLLCLSFGAGAQEVLDKVIGVVGKYPILLSDLQNNMLDEEGSGLQPNKCRNFEMLVFEKLLVAQADHDSLSVSDNELETELNRRMAHYIQKFGSEEKLEKFYGKRTNVLKDELRADLHERMLAEKMRNKITTETKLSPAEVRLFYNKLPQDSLPFINSEVELQQLVKKPGYSPEAKKEAREAMDLLRARAVSGTITVRSLAILYSEDAGSRKDGGFIGNVTRGMMDPAFEAVAFRLKNNEISNVFESAYGYHIIELVQRRGEILDLRHILIMPKLTNEDYFRCKNQLDSLHKEIQKGTISFEEAVKKFSDDANTKQNEGLMINPQNASTKFDNDILNQIDPNMIVTINPMKVGDISNPMSYTEQDGKPAFRILKLKNRIDPHKANLKDDYQKISVMALGERNQGLIKEWIKKRSKNTYIKLDPEFVCHFENEWVITN